VNVIISFYGGREVMVFNATFNNISVISFSFYAMTYMNNQLASVVVCIH
jgi:hypothetical protein